MVGADILIFLKDEQAITFSYLRLMKVFFLFPEIPRQDPGEDPGEEPGEDPGEIPSEVPSHFPGQDPREIAPKVSGKVPGEVSGEDQCLACSSDGISTGLVKFQCE